MKNIMILAIFYNAKTNPENKKYAREVTDALDKNKIGYLINPRQTEFRKIKTAITVGGDGTVLYTANLLSKYKIPILGINFGHRGYLCQVQNDMIEDAIMHIKTNAYEIAEKTRIQAIIEKRNKSIATLDALNEISVGGINRTVHLCVSIITPDMTIDSHIAGDGLIVSTQTGSTAYNINAGGPMLLTDTFSIVANNAFFDSKFMLPVTKSIVVSTDTVMKISDLSHNPSNLPFVITDGIDAIKIDKDDTVTIKKSKNMNRFIVF